MTTPNGEDPGGIEAQSRVNEETQNIPPPPDEESIKEAARRLGINLADLDDADMLLRHAAASGHDIAPEIIDPITKARLAINDLADKIFQIKSDSSK